MLRSFRRICAMTSEFGMSDILLTQNRTRISKRFSVLRLSPISRSPMFLTSVSSNMEEISSNESVSMATASGCVST